MIAACKHCGYVGQLRTTPLREIPRGEDEQTVRVITDAWLSLKELIAFECVDCASQGFVPTQFKAHA